MRRLCRHRFTGKAVSSLYVTVRWLLKPDHTRCNVGAQNHLQTTWLLVGKVTRVGKYDHHRCRYLDFRI